MNIPITACIYLDSGLTNKIVLNRYKSPNGTSYTYKTLFQCKPYQGRIDILQKLIFIDLDL